MGMNRSPRIHPTALVEDRVAVGDGTAIWDHAHLRSGARIGQDCIVGGKTYVAGGVTIGDLCKINAGVYVCHGVTLGRGCMVGAHAVFTNDRFPRATDPDLEALLSSEPGPDTEATVVQDGATIGAAAVIGPGLRLGAYCMVGMGAVVTRNVPPHALVAGNPARLIGLVDRDGRRIWRAGPEGSLPPAGTVLACPSGGRLVVGTDDVRWETCGGHD
jgi:UDP-2-acetamido-3-amino-2,3-dideoxy-glucuronate N-acetyltransferase